MAFKWTSSGLQYWGKSKTYHGQNSHKIMLKFNAMPPNKYDKEFIKCDSNYSIKVYKGQET